MHVCVGRACNESVLLHEYDVLRSAIAASPPLQGLNFRSCMRENGLFGNGMEKTDLNGLFLLHFVRMCTSNEKHKQECCVFQVRQSFLIKLGQKAETNSALINHFLFGRRSYFATTIIVE